MSSHDNEELLNYEDEHDVIPNSAAPATSTNGAAASAVDGEVDKDKKNFTGIHVAGFRDFVLRPEILSSISHLGFEHPSKFVQHERILQDVLGIDFLCQAKSGHDKTAVLTLGHRKVQIIYKS
ncbi:HLA-B associated transcript 1 [Suillus clintonianus]|uniref:HLA-B associated transcript 1 n=1 Tax=Suillus clintonianus TaxID=1904413 RepID=UPI001B85F0C6|nr:HLA-B associated transcript 1 [Suillus clintonianus]KAG2155723.1 HLA-B associated transcript 1 [Suillus clintonianus]